MKFTAWMRVDDRSERGMQRWIALTLVVILLLGSVGSALVWNHRRNRPDKVWVPLPLSPESSDDARKTFARQLDKELRKTSVLLGVATDVHLAEKLGLPSAEAAADELGKRLFVEIGQANMPMSKIPSLNVGVNGKSKEHALLGQIAERLMKDVERVIGAKDQQSPSF